MEERRVVLVLDKELGNCRHLLSLLTEKMHLIYEKKKAKAYFESHSVSKFMAREECFDDENLSAGGIEFLTVDPPPEDNQYLALSMLLKSVHLLKKMPLKIQNDVYVVKWSIRRNPFAIKHLTDDMRRNKEFEEFSHQNRALFLKIATEHPILMKTFPYCLQDDEEFAHLAASCQSVPVFDCLSVRLRDEEELAVLAVRSNKKNFCHVSSRLQQHVPFLERILQENYKLFHELDIRYMYHEEIAKVLYKSINLASSEGEKRDLKRLFNIITDILYYK